MEDRKKNTQYPEGRKNNVNFFHYFLFCRGTRSSSGLVDNITLLHCYSKVGEFSVPFHYESLAE